MAAVPRSRRARAAVLPLPGSGQLRGFTLTQSLPSGRFAAPKLPRIWVPRSASIDVGTSVADPDAARAVRALALVRRAGFARRIAAVRAADGELTLVLDQGPELRFGDATSLSLKLAVASRMLPLVARTSGYVDVTVPARPIAGGNPKVSGRG